MKRILTELQLDKIAAVDRPCQEHASVVIMKRDFSDKEREKLADKGHALPDGSYPIENKGDLSNAVQSFGRAKDKAKVKAHIISRARALGATDSLPDDWVTKFLPAVDLIHKQLVMILPDQPDESDSDDFDTAFDDTMDQVAICDARDEIHPYTHALKCSLVSILTDDVLDPNGQLDAMHNSVGQFMAALEQKYPGIATDTVSAIADKRLEKLQTKMDMGRLLMMRTSLDKARSMLPKAKKPTPLHGNKRPAKQSSKQSESSGSQTKQSAQTAEVSKRKKKK